MEFGKISFDTEEEEVRKAEKRAQLAKILEDNGRHA